MKKLIYFILTAFVLQTNLISQDYTQNVHQYIVRQAWQYLKTNKPEINWDASPMASHIGNEEQGDAENPWDLGLLVVGAFREDEEDPVYGYVWPNETSTHFWNADGGDGWVFCPFPCCGCYPNAYKKAQIYIYGGQGNPIFFQKPVIDPIYGQILGRYYSYDNLFAFYNTGHCFY